MTNYVFQVMGMDSTKYGSLEKFLVLTTEHLTQKGYKTIIFYDSYPHNNDYVKDIKDAGGEIVILPTKKELVKFVWKFGKYILRYKPVLVQSHFNAFMPTLVSFLFFVENRFIFRHSMATNNQYYPASSVKELSIKTQFVNQVLANLSTKVISVSKGVRRQFVNLFDNKNKSMMHYIGTYPNNTDDNLSNHTNETNVIGVIAHGSHVKGMDVLFHGLHKLKSTYGVENFQLLQIGIENPSKNSPKLIALAEKLNIDQNIQWLGIRNDVENFLPEMDIYCQPSRSEGLGLSIVEAQMAGLPVIATDVGGIPEVVTHDETGYLFENEDAEELARHLKKMIDNKPLQTKMGELAKQRAPKRFNIESQTEKLVNEYLEIIEKT